MKYIKASAIVIEFDDEDIVTASGECMDNTNFLKDMGIECDGITQLVDKQI